MNSGEPGLFYFFEKLKKIEKFYNSPPQVFDGLEVWFQIQRTVLALVCQYNLITYVYGTSGENLNFLIIYLSQSTVEAFISIAYIDKHRLYKSIHMQ